MQSFSKERKNLQTKIRFVQQNAIERGLDLVLLQQLNYISNYKHETAKKSRNRKLIVAVISSLIVLVLSVSFMNSILSARCLLPSNYLVWEATRPLADCAYCANVTKPIILRNITRREFSVRQPKNLNFKVFAF